MRPTLIHTQYPPERMARQVLEKIWNGRNLMEWRWNACFFANETFHWYFKTIAFQSTLFQWNLIFNHLSLIYTQPLRTNISTILLSNFLHCCPIALESKIFENSIDYIRMHRIEKSWWENALKRSDLILHTHALYITLLSNSSHCYEVKFTFDKII